MLFLCRCRLNQFVCFFCLFSVPLKKKKQFLLFIFYIPTSSYNIDYLVKLSILCTSWRIPKSYLIKKRSIYIYINEKTELLKRKRVFIIMKLCMFTSTLYATRLIFQYIFICKFSRVGHFAGPRSRNEVRQEDLAPS